MDVFSASVGTSTPVVLLPGKIELTSEEVVVSRGALVLAHAPYSTVRARRTWLSLGSALRMRVGDRNVAVDLSNSELKTRWMFLELLPPLRVFRDVRAGRRAARELLDALVARGADAS